MTTVAEAALDGLDVVVVDGIVRVRDGVDTWLCDETEYDRAIAKLSAHDADPDDKNGAEAYTTLCQAVRGPVASRVGTNRGEWEELVDLAIEAGLVDADDAGMFGY